MHASSSPVFTLDQNWDTGLDWLKQSGCGGPDHDTVALSVNGTLRDLGQPLHAGSTVQCIDRSSDQGLDILRHSAAHVLAQAVKELYPDVQVTIGPVIDNGFYYDFHRDAPFRLDELDAITQRMRAIVDRDLVVHRHIWSRQQAIDFFTQANEHFKVRLIRDLPPDEELSVYQQGDFYDLCRGPHVPSTKAIGHGIHLTKVSGSYWRGDSQNEPLQRIYGTAWATVQDKDDYLQRLEQAAQRDHRLLAQKMNLFHFQDNAPGSVFWHPNGWTIYTELKNYIARQVKRNGYQEINTPQLVDQSLWQASGHQDKFADNMFFIKQGDRTMGLKPMNCPCHVQVYNHSMKSYRDLPLRLAEFGSCMRNEASGSRSGLMRMTSFVQDDAHIFCTPDQLADEVVNFCRLLFDVYKDLGFEDVVVRLSTRPDQRLGTDAEWDHAEHALRHSADLSNLNYTEFPGEGAFYGPKLEFVLKDSLGRLWQCGTLQVDFMLPQRLGALYVDADGQKQHCIMIHRAILGSFERFIGVLLEHTGGHLPLWLAPVQVMVASVSEKFIDYAETVADALRPLRVEIDRRNENLRYKLRDGLERKIPYIIVVGGRDAANGTVCVRHNNAEETLPLVDAVQRLRTAAACPA